MYCKLISTQPFILPESVNQIPTYLASDKAGHVYLCRVAGNVV